MRNLLLVVAFASVGCVTPDIMIQNPLTAQAVAPNRIVKPHGYIENQLALPPGVMSDEATLLSVDPQRICVGVRLHELQAIDLSQVALKLETPKLAPIESGEVFPEQPTQTLYEGLVPQRRQVGMQRVCTAYIGGYCVAWGFRPIYARFYVRGQVPVFETRGRLCFPNGGLATAATEWLSLELRLPKSEGWGGTKRVRFVWGFVGSKG
jgi:hypothetical protein